MLSKHILRWFYYIFCSYFQIYLIFFSVYIQYLTCNSSEQQKYSCSVSFYLYMALKCFIHKPPWNSFSKEHTEDGLSTQDRKNVFIF